MHVADVSASAQGVALVGDSQPGWGKESRYLQVAHPHRFYQHLTQQRATFHPRSDDLFVIGRFPAKDAVGEDAQKGLDVYSTGCGKFVARLGLSWPGIQVLVTSI